MNILILNGSPRKTGTTTLMLDYLKEKLEDKHQIDYLYAYDLNIKACRGCLKCRPDKDCILAEDDGHRAARLIEKAELLVVGSPVYWGNISGPLKVLFDRLVPVFEYIDGLNIRPQQKGKKALIICNSAAPAPFHLLPGQSRGAVSALKTILRAGGYKILQKINIPGNLNRQKDQSKLQKKLSSLINRISH